MVLWCACHAWAQERAPHVSIHVEAWIVRMQPVRVVSIPPRQAMMLPRGRCIARGEQKTVHDIYIYNYIYLYIYNYIFIYIYMCASQIIRVGTRSGTTPVPWPPFHTCLKDPFHTSVPYLWSIRYYIYILMIGCIYIYLNMCNLILHLYAHTRTYIHECIHARIRLLCPSPVIVLASLCLQHLQLLPTLLCDGRDVLGCCQLPV